jgi:hypothetical protein
MSLNTNFLLSDLTSSISPAQLLAELHMPPFVWQKDALDSRHKRILIKAARQSGKSSISAGMGHHTARFIDNSLTLIVSPSEQQSKETMKKVDELIGRDPNTTLVGNASFEKVYSNGSRILALPGTERSVRGYSAPRLIIMDEASRIEDATYKAVRPMLTGNPEAVLIAVTTPFGKSGWFYEEWTTSTRWHKIAVQPAWTLSQDRTKVVPDIPEEEFKKKMREVGANGYYSPRHTQEFLQEELETMDWWWWEQEYGCEFLDEGFSPFDMKAVRDAFGDGDLMFGLGEMEDDDEPLLFG